MKAISWNCRGLGNPTAVRALKKLLKTTCPDLVFFMETRLTHKDKKAKSTLVLGPLNHLFIVDCNISNGKRSGGLALIWNDVINVDIIQSNKNIIDMYITACNTNVSWYATGIYGFPYYSQKYLTCQIIENLSQTRDNSKWILFGDFNLILNSSEKLGGNNIDHNHTNMFNETLNKCDLRDLGFFGTKFTWANNHNDETHIKERLDRFCANSNWILSFPRYTNKHLLRYTSDHCPIMLEFYEASECINYNRHKKHQRFEQLWAQDQECKHIVHQTWNTTLGDSPTKLQRTLHQMFNWGQSKFGDIPIKIKDTQAYLNRLKIDIPTKDSQLQIKAIENKLDDLLKQEEQWWAQRAKVHWLKDGDLNTKYFHHKASQRKRKNYIHSIQDESGGFWQDSDHLHSIFSNHFMKIFDSSDHNIYMDVFNVV